MNLKIFRILILIKDSKINKKISSKRKFKVVI